ncbi:MAG: tyrosine-type recombinase/integrase [Opitutales bacterium]|nr:tyrosine-type recombinase/integrase [Opitutales bacterium]
MRHEQDIAKAILKGTRLSLVDAARLVKNILDFMPKNSGMNEIQFCSKIIDCGKANFRVKEMSFIEGFKLYILAKAHLRKDSLRDIKYLGSRLIKHSSEFASRNFSTLTIADCETWLNKTFSTPSQYNKGRTFLYAIFEFAIRKEWCGKNPIKCIERKRVIEREIVPLAIEEIKKILENAGKIEGCLAPAALMIFAGIRPREVRRLCWRDVDLSENTITVRSICSKTGGVRHVEILSPLKRRLAPQQSEQKICPKNWQKKWRKIRESSGFRGAWVQDVLRHTYASYFAKKFSDLPRLQLNMGHANLSLLRSRYVNLSSLSAASAKSFFN